MLLFCEQVLTIFLCNSVYFLMYNNFVYDVQNATYSSHGAPYSARDLFPLLNTKVKVHYICMVENQDTEKRFRVTLGFWEYLVTIEGRSVEATSIIQPVIYTTKISSYHSNIST